MILVGWNVKVAAVAVAVVAAVAVAGAAFVVWDEEEPVEYGYSIILLTSSSSMVDSGLLPDGWVWVYTNIMICNESDVDIDAVELPTVLLDGDGDGELEEYAATAWFSFEVSDSSGRNHYRWVIWYAVPGLYLDGEPVEEGLVGDAAELSYPSSWTEYSS